jgi:hypothetical protein
MARTSLSSLEVRLDRIKAAFSEKRSEIAVLKIGPDETDGAFEARCAEAEGRCHLLVIIKPCRDQESAYVQH